MALPSLKDYYLAAQIKPLMLWCNQEYVAKWKAKELSQPDIPLQSLLGCPLVAKKHDIQSQWIKFSFDTWATIVKQFNMQNEIRILIWPIHDPDFRLAAHDGGFNQWIQKGVTTWCLLVNNLEFPDFKTMSERYGLAQQEFYRYLQLRHHFDKNIKRLLSTNMSGITQMFIRAYKTKLSKKIIGELYRYINELRGHSTNYVKENGKRNWEFLLYRKNG